MTALRESIERDGFLAPVLIREHDDGTLEVLSGNHRVENARAVGLESVPALVKRMDDATAARVAVNLNTVHGDPDAELLASFLTELDDTVPLGLFVEDDLLANLREFDQSLYEKLRGDAITPDFQSVDASVQPRLDQRASVKCPACEHVFVPS
jgi:hypothetical protein